MSAKWIISSIKANFQGLIPQRPCSEGSGMVLRWLLRGQPPVQLLSHGINTALYVIWPFHYSTNQTSEVIGHCWMLYGTGRVARSPRSVWQEATWNTGTQALIWWGPGHRPEFTSLVFWRSEQVMSYMPATSSKLCASWQAYLTVPGNALELLWQIIALMENWAVSCISKARIYLSWEIKHLRGWRDDSGFTKAAV